MDPSDMQGQRIHYFLECAEDPEIPSGYTLLFDFEIREFADCALIELISFLPFSISDFAGFDEPNQNFFKEVPGLFDYRRGSLAETFAGAALADDDLAVIFMRAPEPDDILAISRSSCAVLLISDIDEAGKLNLAQSAARVRILPIAPSQLSFSDSALQLLLLQMKIVLRAVPGDIPFSKLVLTESLRAFGSFSLLPSLAMDYQHDEAWGVLSNLNRQRRTLPSIIVLRSSVGDKRRSFRIRNGNKRRMHTPFIVALTNGYAHPLLEPLAMQYLLYFLSDILHCDGSLIETMGLKDIGAQLKALHTKASELGKVNALALGRDKPKRRDHLRRQQEQIRAGASLLAAIDQLKPQFLVDVVMWCAPIVSPHFVGQKSFQNIERDGLFAKVTRLLNNNRLWVPGKLSEEDFRQQILIEWKLLRSYMTLFGNASGYQLMIQPPRTDDSNIIATFEDLLIQLWDSIAFGTEAGRLKSDIISVLRQLHSWAKSLVDSTFDAVINENRFGHILFCSDYPLELCAYGDLPLNVAYSVSRIPIIPAANFKRMYYCLTASVGKAEYLCLRHFEEAVIIDAVGPTPHPSEGSADSKPRIITSFTLDALKSMERDRNPFVVALNCHAKYDRVKGCTSIRLRVDGKLQRFDFSEMRGFLQRVPVVIFVGCNTACGDTYYGGLVTEIFQWGARVVIGCLFPLPIVYSRIVIDVLFWVFGGCASSAEPSTLSEAFLSAKQFLFVHDIVFDAYVEHKLSEIQFQELFELVPVVMESLAKQGLRVTEASVIEEYSSRVHWKIAEEEQIVHYSYFISIFGVPNEVVLCAEERAGDLVNRFDYDRVAVEGWLGKAGGA